MEKKINDQLQAIKDKLQDGVKLIESKVRLEAKKSMMRLDDELIKRNISPGLNEEEFNVTLDDNWSDDTLMSDFLYNRSDRITQQEFKDLMDKEYEKVKNNPLYFFKNYFKTKWNKLNEGKVNGEPLDMD